MRRLLLPLILLASLLVGTPRAGAQEPNQVGLWIEYGDGRVETQCVTLTTPDSAASELLQAAGVPMTYDSAGALCSIRDVGCAFPTDRCFCQCATLGEDCTYWSFHTLQPEGWEYSNLGMNLVRVQPGDVHGWRWGHGEASDAAAPAPTSFEQICAAPAAPTAPAATPTLAELTPEATRTGARVSPSVPTSPTETRTPRATALPLPTSDLATGTSPALYLIFGALTLLLLVAILWSRRAA